MYTLPLNPDREEKLGIAHNAKPPKRILAHLNRRRIEHGYTGCSCNGLEPEACAYCRRKLAKEEIPW